MIEEIVPAGVASAWALGDRAGAELFPEEHAAVAGAVESRALEFGTGRRCARLALAELGIPPTPLLPGPAGAPRWPPGVVGSITHCAGYRAAAVALVGLVQSIGIDAEPNEPLPDDVIGQVALDEEIDHLAALALERPELNWDRLLFSCKEAVYKAWFPLTRRWLDFDQTVVRFDPVAKGFTARFLVAGPTIGGRSLSRFSGRWLARNGLLITAIVVEPSGCR